MKPLIVKLWSLSGIAGVIVIVTSLVTAMFRAHLRLISNKPLSYLGVYPSTRTLFSVSLLVSAVLFILFGLYVKQKFSIKPMFLIYFILGQICQIIVALVPDKSGSSLKIVHTIAGFALALSLPFLIRELAHSKLKVPHHQTFVVLYQIEKLTFIVGMGLFIFVDGIAPLGEALPGIGFYLWIFVVTYVANKINNLRGVAGR